MSDGADLIRLIDRRIALSSQVRRRGAAVPVELVRGTVRAVYENTRTVMATLDGGSTPVPVTYPAMAVVPVVGDEVVVARRRDGWLHLLDVLGRDPEPGDHPDLATHDAFGLATDAELAAAIAAHAATDSAHALTSGESWLTTSDFNMSASVNVVETIPGPSITLGPGTWHIDAQFAILGPSNTPWKFTGHIHNSTDATYVAEGQIGLGALGGGIVGIQTLTVMGRLTIASGDKVIVLRGAANLNASLTAKARAHNNSQVADRATGLRYLRVG